MPCGCSFVQGLVSSTTAEKGPRKTLTAVCVISIPACKLMNRCLSELALQFKATKFVRIVADMCIPNYPDMNVPTLLVYGEGDIKANLVGAVQFGGMKMTAKSK